MSKGRRRDEDVRLRRVGGGEEEKLEGKGRGCQVPFAGKASEGEKKIRRPIWGEGQGKRGSEEKEKPRRHQHDELFLKKDLWRRGILLEKGD